MWGAQSSIILTFPTTEYFRRSGCQDLHENPSTVEATILTGFLGAGKTTFLNFVLKSLKHGQRIAVVQNEFGNVSIDDQLMPALH